jgi:hypothetical protein
MLRSAALLMLLQLFHLFAAELRNKIIIEMKPKSLTKNSFFVEKWQEENVKPIHPSDNDMQCPQNRERLALSN